MEQVHIFGPQFSTFVRSVQMCCEEKGIPYTVGTSLNGERIEFQGPQHFALHPFGKVPVLFHGDRHLCETTTICRYLDATFDGPALQPDNAWLRAQVDQWAAVLALYVDQVLVRQYLLEFVSPKGEGGHVRMDLIKQAEPEVIRVLALLEAQLGDRKFIVADRFTLADAIAAPMLDYVFKLPSAELLASKAPHLKTYVQQLQESRSGRRVLIDAQTV